MYTDYDPDYREIDEDWEEMPLTQEQEDRLDEYIESQGGIDKCMNCGKYMYGNQLDKYQVCIKPCRNPNEY